jgi:hypothetical protein
LGDHLYVFGAKIGGIKLGNIFLKRLPFGE